MEKIKVFLLAIIASITSLINNPTNFVSPIPDGLTTTPSIITVSPAPLSDEPQEPVTKKNSKEKFYRIVFLGDSMTDLLGDDFPHLQQNLLSNFPKTKFEILNYGIGATDITSGYDRLTKSQKRHDSTLSPLLNTYPNIIVLESFAYNHWSLSDKDITKYKKSTEDLFAKIQKDVNIKIICGLTIAPDSKTITDGIPNILLKLADKKIKAATIKKYIETFKETCQKNNLAIADAFKPSTDSQGEGMSKYINQDDHLHPSESGIKLYSQVVYKEIESAIVATD